MGKVVVFPELCAFGAGPNFAEPMPGPTEARSQSLAKKHQVWLIPGSIYERVGENIYNTAPIINPAGDVIARYRKMYPLSSVRTGSETWNRIRDVSRRGPFWSLHLL